MRIKIYPKYRDVPIGINWLIGADCWEIRVWEDELSGYLTVGLRLKVRRKGRK